VQVLVNGRKLVRHHSVQQFDALLFHGSLDAMGDSACRAYLRRARACAFSACTARLSVESITAPN
ncbi:MAG: hypothetical protein WBP17_05105, partial [Gemmatimonadota bacterium]